VYAEAATPEAAERLGEEVKAVITSML